jgi:TRAP-type uncharacterized transport system substrate-binding protein
VPFYRAVSLGSGAFRGVTEESRQIAVVNVLVTHERIPETVVYEMATTILANLDALPLMNPLFRGLKELFEPLRKEGTRALEFGGVPVHPGAVRAYKEAGWI